MNRSLLIAAFLLFLAAPSFAQDEKCANNQSVATVNGMVCDFCAQALIKTFRKNDAVSDVTIDLTTKKVAIDMKPGQFLPDAEIRKLVDWSGYELAGIEHVCKKKS